MKQYLHILLFFSLFQIIGFSQTYDSRVLLRNAGIVNGKQTISVKWYTKDLIYPEGVNVYRKEPNGRWQKLNSKPIKKLDSLPASEYTKDSDLHFFVPFINHAKKEDLQGIFMINVLVKSFQSEPFSRFLGIQFEDTTAKAGRSYIYKVHKITRTTDALIGEILGITGAQESIEDPLKNIVLVVDTSKVKIKWSIEEQRFYAANVYRETENKEWKKLNTLPVMISKFQDSLGKLQYPKVFYLDDSLKPGTYTYQLTGIDFFGKESKRSPSYTVSVKDITPPPAPMSLKHSTNNLEVTLTWKNQAAPDFKGLNIYRSIKSDGPFIKLNPSLLPITTETYKDNVTKSGPYYYYITSVDTAGNEGKSYPRFAEVHDIVPPAKPIDVSAKADTGKIILSWQKNKETDLAGYLIYRTINKNDVNNFVLLNANVLKENTYTDKLPVNAKNGFLYKVIAMDSSFNKSAASDIVMARMPDIIPPVKPAIKEIRNFEHLIYIEWIPNKDADLAGYDVYRASAGESFVKLNKDIISTEKPFYRDENSEYATKYSYYVIALDSAGNKSMPSNTWIGYNTFKGAEKTPTNIKLVYDVKSNTVLLNWKYTPDKTFLGYVIYRKENESGTFKPWSEQVKKQEFLDKNVQRGNTYYYEIRIYDTTGKVIKSDIRKIKL